MSPDLCNRGLKIDWSISWRIERARNLSRSRGWAEYCCVQRRHTYLRPAAGARFAPQVSSNEDLLDYCRENRDVRLLAYSPLLGGVYGRPDGKLPPQYTGPDAESRMEELKRVASEHGATMRQVVYAWMLHSDPAIIPLTAPTSIAQLAENLKAVEVRLSTEQMRRLDEAGER
jgi:aryl-alcohol dehydrogenase-like predicted oxidoreductase